MANDNQEILTELKRMNKLLALLATQGKSQNDKIVLLAQLGFGPKEISELLGTTSNVVSVTLHKLRKKPAKKESK
jgi:DNA-directed RNA polymerase specialized sigma24 family protein